jgi:membrane protein
MIKSMSRILRVCLSGAKELYQDEYTYRASALSFTTILSIIPLLSILIYVIEKFKYLSYIHDMGKKYVVNNFLPNSSTEIIAYFNTFSFQAAQAPIFSIGLLFLTSISLIMTIDKSMKMIWNQHAPHKNIVSYLIYPIVILLFPLIIAFIAIVSSYLYFLLDTVHVVKIISFYLVPLIINAGIMAALYKITSNIHMTWPEALQGACIASVFLELTKFGFAIYTKNFANYELIYGSMSTLFIFLIWLYIFWLDIFYGAIVSKLFHEEKNSLSY